MDGIVIFAYNSTFDYVRIAEVAAKQAKKFLNLPVTLITNVDVKSSYFDNVIKRELDGVSSSRAFLQPTGDVIQSAWHNSNRVSVYDLSPYDKTLLIDADYFMFNDTLKHMFSTNSEFACFKEINDLTDQNHMDFRLCEISIPMYWATVIYFTKNNFAKSVFAFMQYIRDNWEYYANLYNFDDSMYRNDFSLSIAVQSLSGYNINNCDGLPGKLHTLFTDVAIISNDRNKIMFEKKEKRYFISNTNVHVLNKESYIHFND